MSSGLAGSWQQVGFLLDYHRNQRGQLLHYTGAYLLDAFEWLNLDAEDDENWIPIS